MSAPFTTIANASKQRTKRQAYNLPRNPKADGGVQALWEASLLRSHVHPSVSKFAESLVSVRQNHAVEYKGDPLADFALMPFLNRMAYKNPKARDDKNSKGRGVSEFVFLKS